jgi:hypothetical protein
VTESSNARSVDFVPPGETDTALATLYRDYLGATTAEALEGVVAEPPYPNFVDDRIRAQPGHAPFRVPARMVERDGARLVVCVPEQSY